MCRFIKYKDGAFILYIRIFSRVWVQKIALIWKFHVFRDFRNHVVTPNIRIIILILYFYYIFPCFFTKKRFARPLWAYNRSGQVDLIRKLSLTWPDPNFQVMTWNDLTRSEIQFRIEIKLSSIESLCIFLHVKCLWKSRRMFADSFTVDTELFSSLFFKKIPQSLTGMSKFLLVRLFW